MKFVKNLFFYGITIAAPLLGGEQQPCYLALIPIDLMNRIAAFLPFPDYETESEFIERTQKLDPVPDGLWQSHIISPRPGMYAYAACKAYCPNKTKFVLLEKTWHEHSNVTPKLTIVCIKKNEILYKDGFSDKVDDIALSRNADMVAFTQSTNSPENFLLKVIYTDGAISSESTFPDCGCHTNYPIAFNKQSTQVIVHHHKKDPFLTTCYIKSDTHKCTVSEVKPYTIFSPDIREKITSVVQKTLIHYFNSKLVCKAFGTVLA